MDQSTYSVTGRGDTLDKAVNAAENGVEDFIDNSPLPITIEQIATQVLHDGERFYYVITLLYRIIEGTTP